MSGCITSATAVGNERAGAATTAPAQDVADVVTPTPPDYPETGRAANPDDKRQPRNGRVRGEPAISARGPLGAFIVTGQTARALVALVKAGKSGVTALEVSSWALRLSAYVFTLRRDYGLAIETVREKHDGGWHGRFVLRCPVVLLEAGQ